MSTIEGTRVMTRSPLMTRSSLWRRVVICSMHPETLLGAKAFLDIEVDHRVVNAVLPTTVLARTEWKSLQR